MSTGITHALSVDVEDWQAGAILNLAGRATAPTRPVVDNTIKYFDLFEEHGFKATWFFLGNVATEFPDLVRMIADAGHEIGVHGYHHTLIGQMSPDEFRRELFRAKAAVEAAAGVPALGYRAPAFSLTEDTWYALDTILEAGFEYDSSLFPRPGKSAVHTAELAPSWVAAPSGKMIFEVPLTAIEVGGRRVPAAGGGWIRHFPLAYTRWAFRHLEREGRSAVTYLHPYEIDLRTPMTLQGVDIPRVQRLRLNLSLKHTERHGRRRQEQKLRHLLANHMFAPIRDVFDIANLDTQDGRQIHQRGAS